MSIEIFSTSDLAFAATLLCKNINVEKIDRSNPKRFSFIFPQNKIISKAISDYQSNKIKVNPRIYFLQLKFLKSLIYEN